MAREWKMMAADGDHYKLAFDKPGTWSLKYNLVWDRVLGLRVFPPEIAETELAYYLGNLNPSGVPLDSRSDYTKGDWSIWVAAMARDRPTMERLIEPVWRFAHDSPDRVPLSDWHWTSTGKVQGFRARPVIGGLYMPMLLDKKVWLRWARP
jgi:hypothetical protein